MDSIGYNTRHIQAENNELSWGELFNPRWRGKVALSINLTSGVFVNQSAAFSDYHGTGGNPSANASYADSAFVANRFRVVQRRYHV